MAGESLPPYTVESWYEDELVTEGAVIGWPAVEFLPLLLVGGFPRFLPDFGVLWPRFLRFLETGPNVRF